VQFHPEVTHTPWGLEIIRNFLMGPCECSGNWTMEKFHRNRIRAHPQIVATTGVCALVGRRRFGVAAVLLHHAIGPQLTCLFVNHGFLRKNEASRSSRLSRKKYGDVKFEYVDASARFYQLMEGAHGAEEKRVKWQRVRGNFPASNERVGEHDFLAQALFILT
jgi:GMP synthase (glutamine-hydrolysing)